MGAGSIGAGDGYRTMGTVHGLEHGTCQHAHITCQHNLGTAGAWDDTGSKQDAIDPVGKRHDVDSNQQTAGAWNHSCSRGYTCPRRQPRQGDRTWQPEDQREAGQH
jgi:hypothetical protein